MSDWFPDIMIDIETTGTIPGRHAIIQLAAVKFNLKQGKIDTGAPFNACLDMLPNYSWDEGTRQWWFADENRQKLLASIYGRMRDARTVLQEISDWVGGPVGGDGVKLWARGNMDGMMLHAHLNDAGMGQLFKFWLQREIRTWQEALFYPGVMPDLGIKREGNHHDALDDCFHQLNELFAACARARQGVIVNG